jgi:Flp pilus assembly protein TadD
MRSSLISLAATVALAISGAAFAMGGGNDTKTTAPAKTVDPNFARAKAMIDAADYKGGAQLLLQVVQKEPKNADAYNLLGFATRKSGDANGALQYYNQALSIDPKHIGAHEYIGEAYLMLGRVQEAEQELARLDSLCVFGCAEQKTLKAAIASYKAGKKPTN